MSKVTFQRSGNTVELASGAALIDIEDKANNEVPFGCRSAACGTCTIDVISGMNNLNPKNEDEQDVLDTLGTNKNNRRLACQCILYGDVTIEALN